MNARWLSPALLLSLAIAVGLGCDKADSGGTATPAPKGETKFGLTEEQRKEVWSDLFRARRKAAEDAERQAPSDGNVAQASKDLNAQLRVKLTDERWAKIATERKLTSDQLKQIEAEATQKNW